MCANNRRKSNRDTLNRETKKKPTTTKVDTVNVKSKVRTFIRNKKKNNKNKLRSYFVFTFQLLLRYSNTIEI